MAKRDPNGPAARVEEVHRLLCRASGRLSIMMAVWKLDVDVIIEIEADVQKAAAAMTDFKNYMVELKARRDAAQQETENAPALSGDGSGGGDAGVDAGGEPRPKRTRKRGV